MGLWNSGSAETPIACPNPALFEDQEPTPKEKILASLLSGELSDYPFYNKIATPRRSTYTRIRRGLSSFQAFFDALGT
jgi:hypothetical protein